LTITISQFESYVGSDEYFIDSKAWLEAYAAKKAVAMVNTDVVGQFYAQEPVKTADVHDNRFQYEANLKKNIYANGFDVETSRKDVVNSGTFVAERITGVDVSMKKGASKYVLEHDLEESTPGDDYESHNIRPPRGEYDSYQIDINYSNVLFKDIEMICDLDDIISIGKPPDKLHERTKSKQERNERLISDKHSAHEGIGIGDNIDRQGDIAFMTFDMHRFVVDTYDDDNGDDDEEDDNRTDGNNIDDDVDALEEEKEEEEEQRKKDDNAQHKKRLSTPDSSEWGTFPNCKGCGFVRNVCAEYNEDGMKFERHPKWYYNDEESVIHMIDITRRIICGNALVTIVIGKVMIAVENFLHAMTTASSKPDVEHHID
jgi:hypothetical protein